MAYRKYKPALYEMLDHRSVKTTKKGGVATPRWFYAGRNATAEPETVSEPEMKEPLPPAPKRIERKPDAADVKRIELSVTRQVLILVGIGLVLSHLVAFMLGNGGSAPAEKNVQEASGLPTLQSARKTPVRTDIYQERPAPKPQQAVEQRPSHASNRANVPTSQQPNVLTAAGQRTIENGICLILCSYQGYPELKPVQMYFNQKGIRTDLGKLGNSYVLFSRSVFESRNDPKLRELRDEVRKLGKGENGRGVSGFMPDTFAGAYMANTENIIRINTP